MFGILMSVLLGALGAWLFLRHRLSQQLWQVEHDAALEKNHLSEQSFAVVGECQQLKQRVSELQQQIEQLRDRGMSFQIQSARHEEIAQQSQVALSDLRQLLDHTQQQRDAYLQACRHHESKVTELTCQRESEQLRYEEKIAFLNDARTQLADQFKCLAQDILEEKSSKFDEQSQSRLDNLLLPLREKLDSFQQKVECFYDQEAKERFSLQREIQRMAELGARMNEETLNLTRALTGHTKTQGTWGEMVLETVLTTAGLRDGHEYSVQASFAHEDGRRLQPDVVVNLPGERHIVIDAKVSLTAYERHVSAETEDIRERELKRHIESVVGHIKALSAKNYHHIQGLNAPDFILMFIPIEPAFMSAVTYDNALLHDAFKRNIFLVSPSTLLATLRIIAHIWRQAHQDKNTQDIIRHCVGLYDKFVGFVDDMDDIGRKLLAAQKSHDDAKNKLSVGRGNLVRQVDHIRALGVKPNKSLSDDLIAMSQLSSEES